MRGTWYKIKALEGKTRYIAQGCWRSRNYGMLGQINEWLGGLDILAVCEVNRSVKHDGINPEYEESGQLARKCGTTGSLFSSVLLGGLTATWWVKFSWKLFSWWWGIAFVFLQRWYRGLGDKWSHWKQEARNCLFLVESIKCGETQHTKKLSRH